MKNLEKGEMTKKDAESDKIFNSIVSLKRTVSDPERIKRQLQSVGESSVGVARSRSSASLLLTRAPCARERCPSVCVGHAIHNPLMVCPKETAVKSSTQIQSHLLGKDKLWCNSKPKVPANTLFCVESTPSRNKHTKPGGIRVQEQNIPGSVETNDATSQVKRSASDASDTTTRSDGRPMCRICWEGSTPATPLLTPCRCKGSSGFVHTACLQKWLISADTQHCEVCRTPFKISKVLKPFSQWIWFPANSKPRTQLWIVILIIFIVTPPVASGLILCHERLEQAGDKPENMYEIAGLVLLGLVSMCLYASLLLYCCCKVSVVSRTWLDSNRTFQIGEPTYHDPVPVPPMVNTIPSVYDFEIL